MEENETTNVYLAIPFGTQKEVLVEKQYGRTFELNIDGHTEAVQNAHYDKAAGLWWKRVNNELLVWQGTAPDVMNA